MKKRIPLRVITERMDSGQEITFDYLDIMLQAIRAGGTQGISIGEMKDRLGALNALEAARRIREDGREPTHIELELSAHTALLRALKVFRFRMILRAAISMIEEVEFAVDAPEEEEES